MRRWLWPAPDRQTPCARHAELRQPARQQAWKNESETCARNMRRATLAADTAHAQAGQTHNKAQQRSRRSKCNTPLRPYTNRKLSAF